MTYKSRNSVQLKFQTGLQLLKTLLDNDMDISRAWDSVRGNTKGLVTEGVGYHESESINHSLMITQNY
jgi:hypothetical protein